MGRSLEKWPAQLVPTRAVAWSPEYWAIALDVDVESN